MPDPCLLAHHLLSCSDEMYRWLEVGPRSIGSYLAYSPSWPCSDEMYRWLELDPADRLPAAADAYERGISLSGCSKATGGPGLRIGWVATRDATREAGWDSAVCRVVRLLHPPLAPCNCWAAECTLGL